MECKFCNAPMEDDMTVCPACGKDVTEETAVEETETLSENAFTCQCIEGEEPIPAAEEAAPAKKANGKAVLGWIVAIILVAAVAAAAMFAWKQHEAASAPIEDVVLMGSETGYTVSEADMTEETLGTVVASSEKSTLLYQLKQSLGLGGDMTDGLTNAELSMYYWDSF